MTHFTLQIAFLLEGYSSGYSIGGCLLECANCWNPLDIVRTFSVFPSYPLTSLHFASILYSPGRKTLGESTSLDSSTNKIGIGSPFSFFSLSKERRCMGSSCVPSDETGIANASQETTSP